MKSISSTDSTWTIFLSNRDSFTSAAQTGRSFQCGLDDMEGAPEVWTSSALAWINSPRNHSITSIVALVSSRFPFPCWHAPSHPSLVWQRHRKYWHNLQKLQAKCRRKQLEVPNYQITSCKITQHLHSFNLGMQQGDYRSQCRYLWCQCTRHWTGCAHRVHGIQVCSFCLPFSRTQLWCWGQSGGWLIAMQTNFNVTWSRTCHDKNLLGPSSYAKKESPVAMNNKTLRVSIDQAPFQAPKVIPVTHRLVARWIQCKGSYCSRSQGLEDWQNVAAVAGGSRQTSSSLVRLRDLCQRLPYTGHTNNQMDIRDISWHNIMNLLCIMCCRDLGNSSTNKNLIFFYWTWWHGAGNLWKISIFSCNGFWFLLVSTFEGDG